MGALGASLALPPLSPSGLNGAASPFEPSPPGVISLSTPSSIPKNTVFHVTMDNVRKQDDIEAAAHIVRPNAVDRRKLNSEN